MFVEALSCPVFLCNKYKPDIATKTGFISPLNLIDYAHHR